MILPLNKSNLKLGGITLKVIINGYSGTMGKVLTNCVLDDEELELVAGVSPKHHDVNDKFNTYSSFAEVKEDADVVIDFSSPLALDGILEYCLNTKTPVVLATTGYNDEEMEKIHEAAKQIPVFLSFNMSLGVNILLKLVKEAAKNLNGFDIEIIEKHHNKKVDSPSGTAVMIANAVKEVREQSEFIYGRHGRTGKRQQNEVGIHAVRGGTIVGEHSAIFAGNDEILEINHSARSKNVFAEGAIAAAKYLVNQEPGFYNMDNMLG
ncbi:MAG: 4-hydroxy-tetrahydrodipicolinate reductase [Intestinibacter bartlettii]|uniref:4-hydroxy-tetrahydrodipicolinate reductase n=1 Tax=Intestinibacter bartlettii TaxID=261299 RepID=UPI0026EA7786|nr:4-hydroxy-tetrahydrodipicolinate reductase [Intestinibacter bartlettii]MDO5009283.1 4-hydroxy-tetrahydrodipicolinate reductase [Intestinibacter bartlettii]